MKISVSEYLFYRVLARQVGRVRNTMYVCLTEIILTRTCCRTVLQ